MLATKITHNHLVRIRAVLQSANAYMRVRSDPGPHFPSFQSQLQQATARLLLCLLRPAVPRASSVLQHGWNVTALARPVPQGALVEIGIVAIVTDFHAFGDLHDALFKPIQIRENEDPTQPSLGPTPRPMPEAIARCACILPIALSSRKWSESRGTTSARAHSDRAAPYAPAQAFHPSDWRRGEAPPRREYLPPRHQGEPNTPALGCPISPSHRSFLPAPARPAARASETLMKLLALHFNSRRTSSLTSPTTPSSRTLARPSTRRACRLTSPGPQRGSTRAQTTSACAALT